MVMEAIVRFRGGERLKDIAASLGKSPSALSYHFRKRGLSAAPNAATSEAICLHCNGRFTFRVCNAPKGRSYCSQRCSHQHQIGERHASWRSGVDRKSNANGYVMVRIPSGYQYARTQRKRGWILEHVLIAEQMVGRKLEKHEVVHHINGDKTDNRPSNLLVCTRAYHIWLHARMSYLYQRAKYAGEPL